MKKNRFKKYLQDQMEEAQKYKWLESEKAGRDLGEKAISDWVTKFGKKFRKKWELEDIEEAKKELQKVKKKETDSECLALLEHVQEMLEEVEEMLEE